MRVVTSGDKLHFDRSSLVQALSDDRAGLDVVMREAEAHARMRRAIAMLCVKSALQCSQEAFVDEDQTLLCARTDASKA